MILAGNKNLTKTFIQIHEYARTITTLNLTGILTLLPRSDFHGVIGIDKKEYPEPTHKQMRETFTHK